MKFLRRFDAWIVRLSGWLIAALVAAMLAAVVANVIARYAFRAPFVWAEEVAIYLMIWIVFLGLGLGLRHGAHVAVTLFSDVLQVSSPRLARLVRVLAWLATAAFLVALVRYGLAYAGFASRHSSTVLRLPMSYVYLAIPTGAALALWHLALSALWARDDRQEAL